MCILPVVLVCLYRYSELYYLYLLAPVQYKHTAIPDDDHLTSFA